MAGLVFTSYHFISGENQACDFRINHASGEAEGACTFSNSCDQVVLCSQVGYLLLYSLPLGSHSRSTDETNHLRSYKSYA